MMQFLSLLGYVTGGAGVLLCLIAGITRLAGAYHVLSFEATSLFMVGTGLMVFACMVKLQRLHARRD